MPDAIVPMAVEIAKHSIVRESRQRQARKMVEWHSIEEVELSPTGVRKSDTPLTSSCWPGLDDVIDVSRNSVFR